MTKLTKAQLRVFLACTERFDKIMEAFPPELRSQEVTDLTDVDIAQQEGKRGWVSAAIRYFNLCSEEYYLFESGLVPSDVWANWQENMRRMLQIPLVSRAWDRSKKQYIDSFAVFFDALGASSKSTETRARP